MTADLRLSAPTLSERLLPLRGKHRGDPIQADDWNTIVQACLSILEMVQNEEEAARARLEANFARSDHNHIGQVSLSWLDPDLQQRIGSAVDAAGRSVVTTLERKVDALTVQVTALQDANKALESRLDRLAANDVDRSLTIKGLGTSVEHFGDLDTRFQKLSADVTKLSPKIDDVFKLRDALTDEQGLPIKLIDLRAKVTDLQRLGDQLTGIDGTPVKITDIQQQIRELRAVSGVGQGLEPRLATLSADLENRLTDKLQTGVRDLRTTLVAEQEAKIGNSVSVKIADAFATQNSTLNTHLSNIEQNLTQSLSTTLLGTVKADLETRGKAVDDKLANVGTLVASALGVARPEIEKSVRDTVTPGVLLEVRNAVGAAETRLDGKVKTIDTTVTTLKDRLPTDISDSVKELTGSVRTEILGAVDTKVKDARDGILATIPTAARDAANNIIGNLDTRVTTIVGTKVGDLDARVKTAVDRATADLPVLVQRSAKEEVDKLDVATLVTRSTAQAEQRINTTVNQRFDLEQANRTDAINRSVISLRGEMVATAKTEVDVLRKENDKVRVVNPAVINTVIKNPIK